MSRRLPAKRALSWPFFKFTPSSRDDKARSWASMEPSHSGALRVPLMATAPLKPPSTRQPGGANEAQTPMLGSSSCTVPDKGALSGQRMPWRGWCCTGLCRVAKIVPARSEAQSTWLRKVLPSRSSVACRACSRMDWPRLGWRRRMLASSVPWLRMMVTGAASSILAAMRMSPSARSKVACSLGWALRVSMSQRPCKRRSPLMPARSKMGSSGVKWLAQARGRPLSSPVLTTPQVVVFSARVAQRTWACSVWFLVAGGVSCKAPALAWMSGPVCPMVTGAARAKRQSPLFALGRASSVRVCACSCQRLGVCHWACHWVSMCACWLPWWSWPCKWAVSFSKGPCTARVRSCIFVASCAGNL